MHIYNLTFTDGKSCRYLSPEPEPTEEIERAGLEAMFGGRLASMTRIITPPPEKLPWKRDGKCWRIGSFELSRTAYGEFSLAWPGGSLISNDKDAISAAVRENWDKKD